MNVKTSQVGTKSSSVASSWICWLLAGVFQFPADAVRIPTLGGRKGETRCLPKSVNYHRYKIVFTIWNYSDVQEGTKKVVWHLSIPLPSAIQGETYQLVQSIWTTLGPLDAFLKPTPMLSCKSIRFGQGKSYRSRLRVALKNKERTISWFRDWISSRLVPERVLLS